MAQTLRFHLDENADPRIAYGLRRLGIDISLTQETGLLKAPDEDHLAFAVAEGRVIVTKDTDFLRMANAGADHPGIVFFNDGERIGNVIRVVRLVWEIMEPGEFRNQIEYV